MCSDIHELCRACSDCSLDAPGSVAGGPASNSGRPIAANSEKIINAKLAEFLRGKHANWSVQAEQTNVFAERQKRPDIVISHADKLTVVVETEFAPAGNVEADAQSRLGQMVRHTGERIEQCIAIKLPRLLRDIKQQHLGGAVQSSHYFFAVFTCGGKEGHYDQTERWPRRGWLEGNLDDLANCVETVALSERRVARGVTVLELAVSQAAGYLEIHAPDHIRGKLARELFQEEGEQTTRMAMAILANAVIFHMRLSRLHPEIQDLADCKTEREIFLKSDVLDSWQTILKINYWPIFSLASDLLRILPEREAQEVIFRLHRMSSELQSFGAADIQDLSGRMFQQLITDRKFLATFYTLPASSTLLAELAMPRLQIDWSRREQITALKVADFACGTGALLGGRLSRNGFSLSADRRK